MGDLGFFFFGSEAKVARRKKNKIEYVEQIMEKSLKYSKVEAKGGGGEVREEDKEIMVLLSLKVSRNRKA
jgi:hypothetical protein